MNRCRKTARAPVTKHAPGGWRDHLAWNLLRILRARASWAWAVVILAIHAVVEMSGGPVTLGEWYGILGLSREGFMDGRIWQIGSYALLHGSWSHAGFNASFVLLVGARVEDMLGRAALMRVMASGISAGGLCHLLLGSGLLVGLSGAGFALLLLVTTLSPESRMLPLPVKARSLGAGMVLAALILVAIDPTLGLPGASSAGRMLVDWGLGSWFRIGHACHLGGALSGWLSGRWILRPRVTLEDLHRSRARDGRM